MRKLTNCRPTGNACSNLTISEGYGIYFGVATRDKRAGSKQDLKTLYTVHADLDAKDFDAANWRARKIRPSTCWTIYRSSWSPLCLSIAAVASIATGHWLHRCPRGTPENIAAVEAVNAALAEFLGSDPAVKDASRCDASPRFSQHQVHGRKLTRHPPG